MAQPLLLVENVSKFYGYGYLGRTKFPAVDNVSFELEDRPSIFTIAGESGSGKTTLARIILGIVEPSVGRVLYRGRDVHKLKSKDRKWFLREVQAVFQDPYDTFNPLKKVDTYLYETAKNLLGLERDEAEQYIDEILRSVGLSLREVKGKYPDELSGGQLQRVSIARALIPRPRLIVADEPVSMVDASIRMNILNMFKDLKERSNISFIYITHDLATAYYISNYIMIMFRGQIAEIGPADKVLEEKYHPYTRALISAIPSYWEKHKWQSMEFRAPGIELKEYIASGCKYATMCPFRKDICTRKRPPMFNVNGVRVACWLYKEEEKTDP